MVDKVIKQIIIPKEKIEIFRGIVILNEIITNKRLIPVILRGTSKIIEPLLITMISKELLRIDGTSYKATVKGEENLELFYKRFKEFVNMFYIYSAVDTEKGVFAYEQYWKMTESEFNTYLNSDRWEDCRIAVAEFKKIDPVELVFMSFLNDNRLDTSTDQWEFNLMSDLMWDEIIEICSNAVHMEDMLEGDAIIVMIEEGVKLAVKLLEEEKSLKAAEDEALGEDVVIEEEVIEVYREPYYYDPYYDPYYVSPFWLLLLI